MIQTTLDEPVRLVLRSYRIDIFCSEKREWDQELVPIPLLEELLIDVGLDLLSELDLVRSDHRTSCSRYSFQRAMSSARVASITERMS